MKRAPLAADVFRTLARDVHWRRKFASMPEQKILHTAEAIGSAKRFVFDDKATAWIGDMIRTVPRSIVHAQEFALQPFPLMYVELSAPVLYQRVMNMPSRYDHDKRLGFLYDNGRVYTIAGDELEAFVMPVTYRLFKPMTLAEERTLCEQLKVSRTQLDEYFWGGMYQQVDPDEQRDFRAHHGMRLEVRDELHEDLLPQIAKVVLENAAGDLRNIIAILLFLNRTSHVRIDQHVPSAPAIIKRKPSAMVSHSVVRLNLEPTPRFYEQLTTGGAWRREHDVRGHFCHDERTRNAWCSTHDWSEYDVNQWRCLACGGLRWWRKEHRRGHKDKGIVRTTYEVTQ